MAPENGAKGIVKGESGFPPREARCAASVDSTRTENRLIEVVSNGVGVVENEYDYMSRRSMKTTAKGSQIFIYDQWNLLAETTANSTNYYVWGLDLSQSMQGAGGVGGLLATVIDGEPYFPAYDANGNITQYTDTNGTVVAHYEYDPFGNVSARCGGIAADFAYRFSSKYTDQEAGLVMYPARPYSSTLGRFLSRDPIKEKGSRLVRGRSLSRRYRADRNLYAFVGNSPISFVDPLGEAYGNPVPPVARPPGVGCCGRHLYSTQTQCCNTAAPRVYEMVNGRCCGNGSFLFDELPAMCAILGPSCLTAGVGLRNEANDEWDDFRQNHPGADDNLFHHCYWSCRLTQEAGADKAQAVGDQHEACNGARGEAADSAADQAANAIGRQHGRQAILPATEENQRAHCRDACAASAGVP